MGAKISKSQSSKQRLSKKKKLDEFKFDEDLPKISLIIDDPMIFKDVERDPPCDGYISFEKQHFPTQNDDNSVVSSVNYLESPRD